MHPSPLLHCLPPPICDPLGRPLVFIRLSELLTCEETETESVMDGLLISLERLRIHLRSLNELSNREITLQCVFLIDLEGLSIHSVVCQAPLSFDIKPFHSSPMTEP